MNAGIHIKKVLMFYSTQWELWKVLGTALALLFSILLKVIFPATGLFMLIFLDMRLGIKKHIRKKKATEKLKSECCFRNIRSEGLRKTFSKIGDYLTVILVFVVFEGVLEYMGVNVKYNNFTISNFVVLLLCLTELKSVDENIRELQNIGIYQKIVDFVFKRKSIREIVAQDDKKSNNEHNGSDKME